MIHYTLLPHDEVKKLRREYKTRLIIVALFFVSCAIAVGIISLLPSYILSYNKERGAEAQALEIQKKREESGAAKVETDLIRTQTIAEKIIAEQDKFSYSDIVQHIISHRRDKITINSFEVTEETSPVAQIIAIIQGKAPTREGLLAFKGEIEADTFFTKVELPISDLAKSRDLTFSMRLTINPAAIGFAFVIF